MKSTSPKKYIWPDGQLRIPKAIRKVLLFVSLVIFAFSTNTCLYAQPCCSTSSLIINTGYDPILASPVPPGTAGGTPVSDPKWKIGYYTPSVTVPGATSFVVSGIPYSLTLAPALGPADVFSSIAASDPNCNPISCVNAPYYHTDGLTGVTTYYMELYREFELCDSSDLNLNFDVSVDNGCDIIFDAVTISPGFLAVGPTGMNAGNWGWWNPYSYTITGCAPGIHRLTIRVQQFNHPPSAMIDPNGTFLNLKGTVSSVKPMALKSESNGCSGVACSRPSISGSSSMCVGQPPITLTGSPAGGTWSFSPPGIISFGTITPSTVDINGVSAGIANVTYTDMCGHFAVKTITVGSPVLTGPSYILCTGATYSMTTTMPGGVWSSTNTAVATVNASTGVVTAGTTTGTTIISYIVGACSAATVVTVNKMPSISGPHICVGGSGTLNATVAGGVWSESSPLISIGASTGVVTAGGTAGTAVVTYISGACSAVYTVTIDPVSVLGGPPYILCTGATYTMTTSVTGGTWSSSNTSVATIGSSSGVVTAGGTTGTATITYALGACSATTIVTVNKIPVISGTSNLCAGAVVTLNATVAGGAWSTSSSIVTVGASSGIVTSGSSTGTAVITYIAGACSAVYTITVNPLPTILAGPRIVCASITVTATPTTGTWSGGGSVVSVSNSGGGVGVVHALSGGTATLTYTTSAGCKSTIVVTVNCPCSSAMDSVHTTLTASGHFGDSCSYLCTASTTVLSGWHMAGYMWQVGSTSTWHASTSTTDTRTVSVPVSGTVVVKVTFYAVDSFGDTCKILRMDTLHCVHPPCYDSTGTYLLVTTTTDPMGNCIYTATVNVTTADSIIGYEWHTTGGATTVVHTGAHTNVYTFTLPPGTTTTVFVKVNIVDFYFSAGQSPCCEADLSKYVYCGDTTAHGSCNDSLALTYINLPEGSNCLFQVTANALPSAGRTVVGYTWDVPPALPITHWTSALSDTRPGWTGGAILVPAGGSVTITVTLITVGPAGDTCRTVKLVTLNCGCDCFTAGTLTSSPRPFCSKPGACCFVLLAHVVLKPGCKVTKYVWKVPGASPVTIISSAISMTYPVTVPSGTSMVVTVDVFATDATGAVCSTTLKVNVFCNCDCFLAPLAISDTSISAPPAGCNVTVNVTPSLNPACSLNKYEWYPSGGMMFTTTTPSHVFTMVSGTTLTVTVIAYATNSAGVTCTTSATITIQCNGKDPVKGCCFDSLNTTVTPLGSMDIHGNCLNSILVHPVLADKTCRYIGYKWQTATSLPSPLMTASSFPAPTLAPGTTIWITVTFYAVNAFGDQCILLKVLKLSCPGLGGGTGGGVIWPSLCIDPDASLITPVSTTGVDMSCNFVCTALTTSYPGWSVIGYQWMNGTTVYPFTTSGIFELSVPEGTDADVAVVVYSMDDALDTCVDTLHSMLHCDSGDGWAERHANTGGGNTYLTNDLQKDNINIYPNPTDNAVTVSSEHIRIKNVQVIDVNGKKVGNYSFDDTKSVRIPMEHLVPGTYLFRVNDTTSRVVTKSK